jgi:hypothetical protein
MAVSQWSVAAFLIPLGIWFGILSEMSMGSSKVQVFVRLVWKHFMRLPPLVKNWGWAGLLIAGIGIGSNGEYLLGLILLCTSAASLALISPRIKFVSSVLTLIAQSVIVAAAVILLVLSFKWTYEVMGNNPWSHLLPRHDYKVTIFSAVEIPRYDRADILLYAKLNEETRIVVPIPFMLYLRIANLQSVSSRIVDLRFYLTDADGNNIPIKEIPYTYLLYLSQGHRATLLKPLLAERLADAAIGGMDSVDGLVLFDTLASFTKPPYHVKIILKDLSGRQQTPVVSDRIIEENLSAGEFAIRSDAELDDTSSWQICKFGDW